MPLSADSQVPHFSLTADLLSRWLIGLGIIIWLWSAYLPFDRHTWLIEQVATMLGIVVVLWLAKSVRFNAYSKWGFFLMFCIHTIGTHYSYSLTPYNAFTELIFGSSMNDWFDWQRNHYDRFVHLSFGLLMTLPISQALAKHMRRPERPAYWLTGHIILSVSALYELMEWAAAIIFGGDLGAAYLGTQGDIWDAQIDIALAGLGWIFACLIQVAAGIIRPPVHPN